MIDQVVHYNGAIPVQKETIQEWVRDGVTRVRIEFFAGINEIIDARDMDEWNEFVDETVGMSLTDLSYGFVRPDGNEEDEVPKFSPNALMFVEGDIDETEEPCE